MGGRAEENGQMLTNPDPASLDDFCGAQAGTENPLRSGCSAWHLSASSLASTHHIPDLVSHSDTALSTSPQWSQKDPRKPTTPCYWHMEHRGQREDSRSLFLPNPHPHPSTIFKPCMPILKMLGKACRIWDLLGGTVDKNLLANARDTGSIPGLGRFHMSQGI